MRSMQIIRNFISSTHGLVVFYKTYKARSYVSLKGEVVGISAAIFLDDRSHGHPCYKARVKFNADKLKKIDRSVFVPGVQAEIVVVAGRRTVLRYLFCPIIDSFGRTFKEP